MNDFISDVVRNMFDNMLMPINLSIGSKKLGYIIGSVGTCAIIVGILSIIVNVIN